MLEIWRVFGAGGGGRGPGVPDLISKPVRHGISLERVENESRGTEDYSVHLPHFLR